MSGVESTLKSEFPEATEAEVKRFVRACQNPKLDADAVKAQAEKLLEDYLDWRSCYGLDYKEEEGVESPDAEDWKFAIEKSLEVNASMRRAKDLEKKLADEQAKQAQEEKQPVSYDIDVSDSQKSEGEDKKEESQEKSTSNSDAKDADDKEETAEMSDDQKKKELSQVIFQHKDKDGNPITDKEGCKILYVLPGLINRRVAQADFYALALSFYLDRKFDRASEEKMTVVIDVRAGEGWPNPVAFMMVKFVHTITRQLQQHYPERLKSLIVFPVPWAAQGVYAAIIKNVFRSEILEKITLISGPASQAAPLPREKLRELLADKVLDLTEQFRLDHFKPIGTFHDE